MECNRDEALRAKAIAEGKLENKDYAGAKKFVLKAQSLFAGLEGLSQMVTTIDVYISAQNKVSGEVDWYSVLRVPPTADDEAIKKQYRKLALLLHPDKNRSVGADGAFKLICEAFSLLSDKSKRLAYNMRRSPKGFKPNVPSYTPFKPTAPAHSHAHAAHQQANGSKNRAAKTPSAPPKTATKKQHNSAKMASTSGPSPAPRSDTFWTICHLCRMHYEYLKMYLNHTLLCPNCQQPFLAKETAPPPIHPPKSSNAASGKGHQSSNSTTASKFFEPKKNVAGSHSVTGKNVPQDRGQKTDPSIAAKAAKVVQQAQQNMKRDRDASQEAHKVPKEGEGLFKKARQGDNGFQFGANNLNQQKTMGSGGSGLWGTGTQARAGGSGVQARAGGSGMPGTGVQARAGGFGMPGTGVQALGVQARAGGSGMQGIGVQARAGGSGLSGTGAQARSAFDFQGISGFYNKPNSMRELTSAETRNMLMHKAQKELRKKLTEWKLQASKKTIDHEKSKVKKDKKETEKSAKIDSSNVANGFVKSSAKKVGNVGDAVEPVIESMNVPDPDFHDFDLDRTETSFEDNEVWAAYDDNDGMPRFYAMVSKVVSRKPFKLKISWLNSKVTSEFGSLDWVGSGFYKTCGDFRFGRYEPYKSINSFSHKVKWSKERGIVHIFPQKGDVWALYKNWSPDWNAEIPDEVMHSYEMVTVLDEYNEEKGVSVAPLVKVPGFKTVFLPNLDPKMAKQIPREEMFRFSHQVPFYRLTDEEARDAPKGCLELDPAAVSPELMQVTMEGINGEAKEQASVPEAAKPVKVAECVSEVEKEVKEEGVSEPK